MRRRTTAATIMIGFSLMVTVAAHAEVRFGKNVRIGGHERAEHHIFYTKFWMKLIFRDIKFSEKIKAI